MSVDERYERQQLIADWDQARLAAATVLVAGVGALGNEVLKNLALLGVGHLVIVDCDRVERSNLSRTILFRESDIGTPKVLAAAAAIKQINPAVKVTALDGDLRFVLGLARLHACTLALGCLDNQGARAFLSRLCVLAGVPLLDAAMGAFGGEVRSFLDIEGPCFSCTLPLSERRELWLRYSCSSGFRASDVPAPQPTMITTAAVVGGLLVQEALQLLRGQPVENGCALVYSAQAGRLHRASFSRARLCPNHVPLDWQHVEQVRVRAETLTAEALLAYAGAGRAGMPTLDLGRDLVISFDCPMCQQVEEVGRVQGLVDAAEAVCPGCGVVRSARVIAEVRGGEPWANWSLARLGIQPGDVVNVRVREHVWLYAVPFADAG